HESFKVGCDWSRAAFGPGGRLLSVGAADGAAYVWNTHSGRLEAVLKDHTSAVTAVSWHPQSGLLASVDRGKRAVCHNVVVSKEEGNEVYDFLRGITTDILHKFT
ncbi:autophagy-related protein 16-1, partial [Danaus plexippus plexippus]